MYWYGTCLEKGILGELYILPGAQYISAVLLPAALTLHVWATETLGKVGTSSLLQTEKLIWCIYTLLAEVSKGLAVHHVLLDLQAYDRLVVPDKLVRSGPYAWCQHPIYTSYMLLFSGLMLWFGSEECFVLLLYVCWRYYKERIAIEAQLLEQAFGNEYIAYKEHTGSFLPRFF